LNKLNLLSVNNRYASKIRIDPTTKHFGYGRILKIQIQNYTNTIIYLHLESKINTSLNLKCDLTRSTKSASIIINSKMGFHSI